MTLEVWDSFPLRCGDNAVCRSCVSGAVEEPALALILSKE